MLTFCSLWGSPGVTTVAYRVATAISEEMNRYAMVAECDTSGGDLAVRFAMAATPGLASLAAAARRGAVGDQLWDHVQEGPAGVGILLGLTGAEQSVSLGPLWATMAALLQEVRRVEVVVDVGRAEPGFQSCSPFLAASSRVVVCVRPEAAALVHSARRIESLLGINPAIGIVLVGDGPYGSREVEEATGLEVMARLDSEVVEGGSIDGDGPRGVARMRPLLSRKSGGSVYGRLARRLLTVEEDGGDPGEGCAVDTGGARAVRSLSVDDLNHLRGSDCGGGTADRDLGERSYAGRE